MKWTIVAFEHPIKDRSVLYRQRLTDEGLVQAMQTAIIKGANLMSIRGFKDEEIEETGEKEPWDPSAGGV